MDKLKENDFVLKENNFEVIIDRDLMEKADKITIDHSLVDGFTILSDRPLIGICSYPGG
ncbi:hypothetical protein KKH38_00410 [Patescibacteria group bacterium]|nr:hypothetical protein [Patescibacteria group bacterium]MBU4600784.1 hypothetical protein [Patescibacteria group bacterium]MCG2698660.1 hypothetical protein [Candidatus Parcubacteria bacterium]